MSSDNIQYYSGELAQTCDQYIGNVKKCFSEPFDDVILSLQDDELVWKRKFWVQGKIKLQECHRTLYEISDLLLKLCQDSQVTQQSYVTLKGNHERIAKENINLRGQLQEFVKDQKQEKMQMEKRFFLLLNEKKKRICQLTKDLESRALSSYDRDTDDEDDEQMREDVKSQRKDFIMKTPKSSNKPKIEDIEKKREYQKSVERLSASRKADQCDTPRSSRKQPRLPFSSPCNKRVKRKLLEDDTWTSGAKSFPTKSNPRTKFELKESRATTSKADDDDYLHELEEDLEVSTIGGSNNRTPSDESSDDLVLRIDETQQSQQLPTRRNISLLNCTEEEPEEDLFASQSY